MIAIALANQPRLLIADEPTNAMEPTTQAQIFRLLSRLNQNNNTTILLISHDLRTMSQWADRINVMYCGQTVETAQSEDLMSTPHHPYTQALIRAMPDFGRSLPHKKAVSIPCQGRSRRWRACRLAVVWGLVALMRSANVLKRHGSPAAKRIFMPVISR